MWLAFLITSFGAVSIGTAFVTSYSGLIVTRVFLGLAEGGTLVCGSTVFDTEFIDGLSIADWFDLYPFSGLCISPSLHTLG
jgi:MFS family permease